MPISDLISAQESRFSFRVSNLEALARPPVGVSTKSILVFSCGLIGFLSAYTTPEPSEVAQTSIQFTEQPRKSLYIYLSTDTCTDKTCQNPYMVQTGNTSEMPRWGENIGSVLWNVNFSKNKLSKASDNGKLVFSCKEVCPVAHNSSISDPSFLGWRTGNVRSVESFTPNNAQLVFSQPK